MADRDLTPEIDQAIADMDRLLARLKRSKKGPPRTSKQTRMAVKALAESALFESAEEPVPVELKKRLA